MKRIIITHKDPEDAHLISERLISIIKEKGIPYICSDSISERGSHDTIHIILGAEKGDPIIERNKADIIISGDPLATVHAIDFLKESGYVVTECSGKLSKRAEDLGFSYPDTTKLMNRLKKITEKVYMVPAKQLSDTLAEDVEDILLGQAFQLRLLPEDEETDIKEHPGYSHIFQALQKTTTT